MEKVTAINYIFMDCHHGYQLFFFPIIITLLVACFLLCEVCIPITKVI